MQSIGYLVPEFPGQTHNFFWREISALRDLRIGVKLFSTRRPPHGVESPSWASFARGETRYLFPLGFGALFFVAATLIRAGGARVWKCLVIVAYAHNASFSEKIRMLALLIFGARLGQECMRFEVNHIHVHSCGDSANIAMFASILCGISYSLTLHNPVAVYGNNQRSKWRNARFGIIITRHVLEDLRAGYGAYLPELISVAPMGVNTAIFRRTTQYSPYVKTESLRVFCCARLNPAKGHIYLLDAIDQVRRAGISVSLEIAGEDDVGGSGYRRVLESKIDSLGISRYVRLLGAVSEETVLAGLEASHIFVLASLEEPLGVALMEAMAMEVPVVATRSGGVPELVTDEVDGLLVEPQDASELSRAIMKLALEPGLAIRLGVHGRARIESNFSHRNSAERIAENLQFISVGDSI